MAVELGSFELNTNQFDRFIDRMTNEIDANVVDALHDLRLIMAQTIKFQQVKFHSSRWPELSRKYKERKEREYSKGKIRFLRKLTRTGRMIQGYMDEVTVNIPERSVEIYYPVGQEVKAMAHQGTGGKPKGMKIRPFDLDEMKKTAFRRLENAIRKGHVISI